MGGGGGGGERGGGVLSRTFTIHRTVGEGGGYLLKY